MLMRRGPLQSFTVIGAPAKRMSSAWRLLWRVTASFWHEVERQPNRRGAALHVSRLRIGKRSIAYIVERHVRPRLPVGVGRIERVELTFTPGRRVYPNVISATIVGVDTPGS
jgi:hypothetical protein